MDEFKLPDDEFQCRKQLADTSIASFIIVIGIVGVCSIALVIIAICIFVSVRKRLGDQMKEAELRAHEVMDAILVTLIPQGLLAQIAPQKTAAKTEPEKRERKKKKKH